MVDTADSKSAALMCVRVRISLPVPIKKIMLASSNGQDSGFSYQQSGFDSPCEYQTFCLSGGIGRHKGLKIPRPLGMRVRSPPQVPNLYSGIAQW